ncbi:hypothetical protein E4U53_007061 [Claviceps sorghi]|nr:hypothetical protein E4U53_007061 [Claviceps sorghi]
MAGLFGLSQEIGRPAKVAVSYEKDAAAPLSTDPETQSEATLVSKGDVFARTSSAQRIIGAKEGSDFRDLPWLLAEHGGEIAVGPKMRELPTSPAVGLRLLA